MLDMECVRRAALVTLAVLVAACGPGPAGAAEFPVTWDEKVYQVEVTPSPDPEGWARWMARPWESDDEPRTFTVYDKDRNEVPVRSCEELFHADERGWRSDYVEGRILRAWASMCYGGRAIAEAAPAAESHVEGFVLDGATVRSLPPAMGFVISRDDQRKVERLAAEGRTLGDYVGGGGQVVLQENGSATLSDGADGRQSFSVDARGDFNRDGVQDLLVSSYGWIEGASYWFHQLWVITRDAPGAPLRVVEEIPVMGPL